MWLLYKTFQKKEEKKIREEKYILTTKNQIEKQKNFYLKN